MLTNRIFFNVFHSVQERQRIHTLLASQLQLVDLQQNVGTGHIEMFPVSHQAASPTLHGLYGLGGAEDLEYRLSARLIDKCCPCTWIGRQASHEIIYTLGWLVPAYLACLLENLWSGLEWRLNGRIGLRHCVGMPVGVNDFLQSAQTDGGSARSSGCRDYILIGPSGKQLRNSAQQPVVHMRT